MECGWAKRCNPGAEALPVTEPLTARPGSHTMHPLQVTREPCRYSGTSNPRPEFRATAISRPMYQQVPDGCRAVADYAAERWEAIEAAWVIWV